MVKVLQVNKVGNRIRSYICTDGREMRELDKRRLAGLISEGKVQNAYLQVYNGSTIIRIKDNTVRTQVISKEQERAALQLKLAGGIC